MPTASCTDRGPCRLSGRGWCIPFRDPEELVDLDVFEDVHPAADPPDLDPVDAVAPAQSEVKSASPMALVATTAVDFVDLGQIAGNHFDIGADAVSIAAEAARSYLNGLVLCFCSVT